MMLRRGWCPGALRPMETGDGLLVRVRPRAGSYSLAQLRAIAAAARHGNGEIDLTNRANLQLRGLTVQSLPDALALLGAAGLIDRSAAVEQVRNVIVAPLAGLGEPAADSADASALATALEAALAAPENADLAALPGKFGFAVETRAAPLPHSVSADIQLSCDGPRVLVTARGSPPAAVSMPAADAVPAAIAIARAFCERHAADPTLRRMSDADAVALLERAGFVPEMALPRAASMPPPVSLIGPDGHRHAFGVGLPFGRITGDSLAALVDAAATLGIDDIRPSPQRCLVFPLAGRSHGALARAANTQGLITDPADPRLAMDVCPGSPACARATTNTRADADFLASLWHDAPDRPASIHISGCAKGCARASAAELTLVARDGQYDLIRHGRAGDTPALSAIPVTALCSALSDLARGRRA